jgi:O-antigen ligase
MPPPPSAGAPTVPVAAPTPRSRGAAQRGAPPPPPAAPVEEVQPFWRENLPLWPWKGVKWNLSYIAFLVYAAVIVTYAAPLGQAAMIVALLALPFSGLKLRFPPLLLFFGLYCVFAVASYPNSRFKPVVWMEVQDLARVFLIVFVAVNVLAERTRLRFFILWYLACFGLYPVRGAIFNQFIYRAAEMGRIAWNGMFANPNDMAAYLFLPLALAAATLYTEQKNKYVVLAAKIGCVLIPLIIFMTQSRGALLAMFVVLVIVLAGHKQRAKFIMGLVVVGAVVGIFAPTGVWGRLGDLATSAESGQLEQANDNRSAEQRFEIWKVAAQVISENSVTGVGYGAYPLAHMLAARREVFEESRIARGARDAHSTYLEAAAEVGIPGFIVWVMIFIPTYSLALRARKRFKTIWPHRERELAYVQLALIAYALAGIFGTWHRIPFTYIHMVIMWALATVGLEEIKRRETALRRGRPI